MLIHYIHKAPLSLILYKVTYCDKFALISTLTAVSRKSPPHMCCGIPTQSADPGSSGALDRYWGILSLDRNI